MKPFVREHVNAVLFALALLAGALLRAPAWFTVIGQNAYSKILWYDEAYSAFFASRPLLETIRLSGNDTTPGLFAVLLSFWSRIFGDGVGALAAFPFLLSLAGIVCVFFLGRELFDSRTGVAAALLLALNPLHVKYATEIRAYNLLACLAALSLLFAWRYLCDRRAADAAAWGAIAVLGMYTHYVFAALLAVEAVFMGAAFATESRRELKRFVRVLGGIGLAFVPQMLLFRRWGDFFASVGATSNLVRGYGHGGLLTIPTFFSTLAFGQEQSHPMTPAGLWFSTVAGVIIMIGILAYILRARRELATRYLVFVLFVGIAALMAGKLLYSPRYFLVFAPAFAVLAGRMLSGLRPAAFLTAFAICAAALGAPLWRSYAVHPAYAFTYYAPAFADRIAEQAEPGDLVLADHYTDILFRRYYRGPAPVVAFF